MTRTSFITVLSVSKTLRPQRGQTSCDFIKFLQHHHLTMAFGNMDCLPSRPPGNLLLFIRPIGVTLFLPNHLRMSQIAFSGCSCFSNNSTSKNISVCRGASTGISCLAVMVSERMSRQTSSIPNGSTSSLRTARRRSSPASTATTPASTSTAPRARPTCSRWTMRCIWPAAR